MNDLNRVMYSSKPWRILEAAKLESRLSESVVTVSVPWSADQGVMTMPRRRLAITSTMKKRAIGKTAMVADPEVLA